MVKKIATCLFLFTVAALFALWFITDLQRAAPVAVGNLVLRGAAALIFLIAGVAVWRTKRSRSAVAPKRRGVEPRDRDGMLHDDSLTTSQNSLLNALHDASKQDSDATIGVSIDPVTGERRYQVRRK